MYADHVRRLDDMLTTGRSYFASQYFRSPAPTLLSLGNAEKGALDLLVKCFAEAVDLLLHRIVKPYAERMLATQEEMLAMQQSRRSGEVLQLYEEVLTKTAAREFPVAPADALLATKEKEMRQGAAVLFNSRKVYRSL